MSTATVEKSYTESQWHFVLSLLKMAYGREVLKPESIRAYIPFIEQIRELKRKHNAVILSHYYMPPYLQIKEKDGGVADFVGDSLALSIEAARTKADYIIFCGVKFMAETAFILNPAKTVLLPDMGAGCSLAESIKASDVKFLKQEYPGVPVMAYINTYAETKAEADICCTSRNALAIAESFDSDKIIFIPDIFMGRNLSHKEQQQAEKKSGSKHKEFILWGGSCEVHEQFNENIEMLTEAYPQADVLLHWEVPDQTVTRYLEEGKGMVGSTSDIISYVAKSKNHNFILGSECDLGATLKGMFPEKSFVTPCLTCRYMKKINLQNTLNALLSIGTPHQSNYEIRLDENLRQRAELPLRRMLEFS